MNDPELNSLLKKARTPQPPEEFWEDLPGRLARQLNHERTDTGRLAPHRFPRWAWVLATATCVVIAFIAGHWHGQMETASSKDTLASAKLIRETLAMFPNRVRAIVEDEHGLNLVLSDSNNVPASPPLYVRVCD